MESVVLEKYEFQNQNESPLETILAFVFHQDSNAKKTELLIFLGQYSLNTKVFSDSDLGGRNQSVFTKEDEPEHRIESKIQAFGQSCTIRIPMQGRYQSILNRRLQKQTTLD